MNRELKKAIINWMFDNAKTYNLVNATSDKFTAYIYDSDGNFLIGGEQVLQFIREAEKLI